MRLGLAPIKVLAMHHAPKYTIGSDIGLSGPWAVLWRPVMTTYYHVFSTRTICFLFIWDFLKNV